MPTTKFASIKARRIRVTALDTCGNPVRGDVGSEVCSTIVTSGFVSVGASAQVEDGEEFIVKNAWGEFCVNDKDASRVKRWDLTIEFCEVDPELMALLSGGRVFDDVSGKAIGGTFGESVGTDFALELWTKIAGGACEAGATGEAASWIYWVFPHVTGGVIGDLTFENGPLSLSVTANTQGAGTDWGLGPYTPAILPAEMESDEHVGYVVTSEAPPVDTDGCTVLPEVEPVPATGATQVAGVAGTWTPSGSTPPTTVANLIAGTPNAVVASPATAWTTGSYMQTGTAGAPGQAHWSGSAWVAGPA